MKKLACLVVAGIMAVAVTASAETTATTEVKETPGKTVEKTEVKGERGKITQETVTTSEGEMQKTEIKGKAGKMEKETVETKEGKATAVKTHLKKGLIKDINVSWVYYQEGTEYIIEYDVKDNMDPELLEALGAKDAKNVTKGIHKIVSTSPYTIDDFETKVREIIVNNLKTALVKEASK